MTTEELYLSYDGPIPLEKQRIAEFGSQEAYNSAFYRAAALNFRRQFREGWRARKSWKITDRYSADVKKMEIESNTQRMLHDLAEFRKFKEMGRV